MNKFAYFDMEGNLLSLASSKAVFPNAIECEVAQDADANKIYYDLAAKSVQEKMLFALEVSRNCISGLPQGTAVQYSSERVIVDDGSAEFEADVEEELLVYLDHPHFVSQYVTVPTGPEEA
jgi:hypothetical protein